MGVAPAEEYRSRLSGWSRRAEAFERSHSRMGNARIPTALLSDGACDAVAFHVLPDRRSRNGSQGNNFIGHLQRRDAKSRERYAF